MKRNRPGSQEHSPGAGSGGQASAGLPSRVEEVLEGASRFAARYAPRERMRAVVVDNFPALGKAAAMRFLEWAQENPQGVCSLPTGKTPEYFIKWVQRIVRGWDSTEVAAEVHRYGLGPERPRLDGLTFVQVDEFYPISPERENSFHHYVRKFYIDGFGLDPGKAMLMDCSKIGLEEGSGRKHFGPTGEPEDHMRADTMDDVWPGGCVDLSLRHREPSSRLERVQKRVLAEVDQWCDQYEARIRGLGGIGFFMGGLGPDGHVAFNCRGSGHFSTTRLDQLNYESQAAAAGDLGGIEAVRRRKVITIGLGTITYNPACVALICAAGEAKAAVVRDAVQEPPHVNFPATALHRLPRACLLATEGAAGLLVERQRVLLQAISSVGTADLEGVLVPLCLRTRRRLVDLTAEDVASCPLASCALRRAGRSLEGAAREVRESIIRKIERGTKTWTGTRFLHTEPHHDDIMLGYLPVVLRATREASNEHHFVCATSGFNSVSAKHMLMMLDRVAVLLQSPTWQRLQAEGYFSSRDEAALAHRRRDVWKFLDGVAAGDAELRDEGSARRLVANLCQACGVDATPSAGALLAQVQELRGYFRDSEAGQKDPPRVQLLKGCCREFEAECVWGYIGWQIPNISHLRLGFYTADIFAPEPTHQRDVAPVLDLMRKVRPQVVSVALDPEASGPDTHYKVLQAATAAIEQYAQEGGPSGGDLVVWGYRNVWFRFEPREVSTIVPVSLQTIATLDNMFLSAFESQRDAEFPAYEVQGPFCEMSRRVQVQQYDMIETCLGYQWFHDHPSPLIRATRGLVFLREMSVAELLRESRALRRQAEDL